MRNIRTWIGAGVVALAALLTPKAEAKFVFPYNHPDLDWYSIETEHFVIHYPQSKEKDGNEHYLTGENAARKAAKVAEEMYAPMTAEFNYYIKEKVHIVILNQSDSLEGFTIPPWDWIEISANPGEDFYRQRGRMDWMYDVLVHEYAHVVSLKAQATMTEGIQGVSVGVLYTDGVRNSTSGGELFIGDTDPFFWVEGGAEYWSDEAGYNWWTPSRDMHIRTTVLEGRLLNYAEWRTTIQSMRWGDGERGYQQGYSFAQYLRQRFGPDTYQKFGLEYAKGWRADWTTVIEDVTGVPGEQLYNDWVAYVTDKYTQQYDKVKAEGEVAGREISTKTYDWEYTDPSGRDKFNDPKWKRKWKWSVTGKKIAQMERERAKEATGTWQIIPQYSADGKWYGVFNRYGIVLQEQPEGAWTAFADGTTSDANTSFQNATHSFYVPAQFMYSWDYVPNQDAVVVTGYEDDFKGTDFQHLSGFRLEKDGYNWNQLWYVPFSLTDDNKEKNLQYEGYKDKRTLWKEHARMHPDARPIPNTLRGQNPAISPDGKQVAYLEYTDGRLNLVLINLDGSGKRYLTDFKDDTWFQRIDWSPDGKQLVVPVFRNFQQDLLFFDVASGKMTPLNWDRWEDQDPVWTADGKIYFSSDPTGIFNVFCYDTASQRITQITNVIGGAQAPSITPEGNLLYSAYTGHGWKVYGVKKEDFLNKDVTNLFRLKPPSDVVEASWKFEEDLSSFQPVPYKVKPDNLMAPTAVPIVRVTNDALDNTTLQAGAQLFMQDYVEKNGFFATALLGEDSVFMAQYFNQMWAPSIFLMAVHQTSKFNYGYLLDEDNNAQTTVDQTIYEGRNAQSVTLFGGGASYPFNDRYSASLSAGYLGYGFRTTSEAEIQPYQKGLDSTLSLNYSNIAFLANAPNPSGGRNIDLTYTHGFTDIVFEPYGGRTVDDGELLDNYQYNKVEGRWTEQIPFPSWGWMPDFLKEASRMRHTIQVDLQGGFIDRNVTANDEFRAGGQHPFYQGSDSLRPNTQFSGYPFYSLAGETMFMGNLAYRFPIRRELNLKMGPLYLYDLTGQFMGTAGNLWSFVPPSDPSLYYRNGFGERVARDPEDIRREIPFVDVAYKNGNRLLVDAGAEIRASATMMNSSPWNSFFRVSYGFNEVRGYGDVDGNDVQDTTDSAIGDELSNETEQPGFRFYLGLGTGW